MVFSDLILVAPFSILALGSVAVLLAELAGQIRLSRGFFLLFSAAAVVFFLPLVIFGVPSLRAFGGMLTVDPFGGVAALVVSGGLLLTALLQLDNLRAQRVFAEADSALLLMLAALGALVMCFASHLILLFIGLELMSLSVYVLSSSARGERAGSEGALKYFLLGAYSSAFMLFGIVLVYAASGSMLLSEIATKVGPGNLLFYAGAALVGTGFAFKVALVPFHFWTPDVYQGAPSSVSGFMAVVVKTAAFCALARVVHVAFGGIEGFFQGLFWVLAAITMTWGNLAALSQSSIKRMLAYSSIAHAGYILLGFLSLGTAGLEASLFYLVAYGLMTIASFGVVMAVSAGTDLQYGEDDIRSLANLGWRSPLLGIAMTVAVLSLAGFPPLAGFFGKLLLFKAALNAGFIWLVVLAALNSFVALFYYLRVVVVMYFSTEETANAAELKTPLGAQVALALATFGTITLGLFSGRVIEIVTQAAKALNS